MPHSHSVLHVIRVIVIENDVPTNAESGKNLEQDAIPPYFMSGTIRDDHIIRTAAVEIVWDLVKDVW